MILNLAVILIFDWNIIDNEVNNLSKLLEVMKKSENKEVRKNGVRALSIFLKLTELTTKKTFLIKFALVA